VADPPKRIQRSRAKGWRMPENAIYVGRPSKWGNPFSLDVIHHAAAIGLTEHGSLVDDQASNSVLGAHEWVLSCHRLATSFYREYLLGLQAADNSSFAEWIAPLAGKDLACFCSLDHPCHADVLLELANG